MVWVSEACLTYTRVGRVQECLSAWWCVCVCVGGGHCGSDVYSERLCCFLKPRSSGGWDSSHEISAFQVEDGPRVTLLLIKLRGKSPSNLEICTWSCCGNFQQQTFSFISSSVCVFICWLLLRRTKCPQSDAKSSERLRKCVIDVISSESILMAYSSPLNIIRSFKPTVFRTITSKWYLRTLREHCDVIQNGC